MEPGPDGVAAIPVDTTPGDVGLRDPAHRVSPRAALLWGVRAGLATLVLLVLLVLLVAVVVAGWVPLPWWTWPLWVLVALAYTVGMPLVRYRVHRWESTDAAVYTQTGWLSRERRIAPMSRVQTVDLEQGVASRVLGIASVTVTTASAAGPLVIDGIDRPVAEALVAELTRRTGADPGDAT